MDMTHAQSILIDATPTELYDLVTDIGRTGEWSPICVSCSWEEGTGPVVGAWFTGRNVTPEREWETRSQVVVAEPGVEFAWQVGGDLVRWGYRMSHADRSTELTEEWEFLPGGLAMFREKFGDRAQEEIEIRTRAAYEGIPATLAAIKKIAEQ